MELLEKQKRIAFYSPFELIPIVQDRNQASKTGRVDIIDMENEKMTHQGEYTQHFKGLRRAYFQIPEGAKTGYLQRNGILIDLFFANIQVDLEIGWSDDRKLVYYHPSGEETTKQEARRPPERSSE